MPSIPIAVASALLALVLWQFMTKRAKINPQRLPLPPGPRPLPLIGNALDMPAEFPWKTFREWTNKYGALAYFNLRVHR